MYGSGGHCGRSQFVRGHSGCRSCVEEIEAVSNGEWMTAAGLTYEVTGMSPQSMTLPQKLKGFDFIGLFGSFC